MKHNEVERIEKCASYWSEWLHIQVWKSGTSLGCCFYVGLKKFAWVNGRDLKGWNWLQRQSSIWILSIHMQFHSHYRHTSFYYAYLFIMLIYLFIYYAIYCTLHILRFCFVLNKLRVCGYPSSSKSMGPFF